MTVQQRIEIIKKFPLFTELEDKEIEILAENAEEKTFPPHTIVLSQDRPADGVYLIYKGLIKIYIITPEGKIIPIRVKGPLYMVGEVNIVDDKRNATMETILETQALMLTKEDCKRVILKHSEVAFTLIKIIVEKLYVANKQTESFFSSSLENRTIHFLRELGPHFPDSIITLSHEEIASIVGATRARVTEVLHELCNQNLITISHRKIKVL